MEIYKKGEFIKIYDVDMNSYSYFVDIDSITENELIETFELSGEKVKKIVKCKELKFISKDNNKLSSMLQWCKEQPKLIDMCNQIKSMPLDTLEDIKNAKEKARSIPMSAEKVILFKFLIGTEDEIKKN